MSAEVGGDCNLRRYCRNKKQMCSDTTGDRCQSARTHPGVTSCCSLPVVSLPVVSLPTSSLSTNRFSDLEEDNPSSVAYDDNDDNDLEYASPGDSQRVRKLSSLSNDLGSIEHLVVSCVVQGNLEASAMVDCGATSQFMDEDFA